MTDIAQQELAPPINRSDEQQAVIDTAIDLMLSQSVETHRYNGGELNLRANQGFRIAAVTLAIELDGTQAGRDRVASFYAGSPRDDRAYSPPEELETAYSLAISPGVSPAVGEVVLSALLQRGRTHEASDVANKTLERHLSSDELLSLATKQAVYRSSADLPGFLKLARANGVDGATERKIVKILKGR